MKKIGIIDIGSNTARLVLVKIYDNGSYKVFDQLKESIRLGQDMGPEAILKPRRILQTIKTLQMFKRLCEANEVDEIIAVATAAVRTAANQRSFLDELFASTGITLKVLTGEQEANLAYQGVINTMNVDAGVIMDIGGGSTELIHFEKRAIKNRAIMPFGTINLTDMFNLSDKVVDGQVSELEKFVSDQLSSISWLSSCKDLPLIGVGGSFRNLGKIIRRKNKYPIEVTHGYSFYQGDVLEVYNSIKRLDLDRRLKIKGLSNERADIFLSAVTAIHTVIQKLGSTKVLLSGSGLRDGLIFQQILPGGGIKPVEDVLDFSLNNLVGQLDVNQEHSRRVCTLALSMFEQLRQLHKLPATYQNVLKAAALLHDSGISLSYYNHQRHSFYFIMNSNIFGLTHREIAMSAFAAAAHRKEMMPKEFTRYLDLLKDGDDDIILKIGVLVRIAESFDRTMTGIISSVACDVLGDSVIMKTQCSADASLEIKDALSSNDVFKKAYGKNLVIL